MCQPYLFVYLFFCFVFRLCRFSNFLYHLYHRMSFMLQNFILIYVCIHSHIPCHCEEYTKWAKHNHSLGICFFFYKNLSSWFNRNKLALQYTLTQDASYASHGQDPVGSYFVTDFCIHNPDDINNWKCITQVNGYRMVLLLQQYWLEIVNMCNSEL
jgi:hypothetical protein